MWADAQLESASVPTARLDALVLMEDLLGKNRAWVLAHADELLPLEKTFTYRHAVARRGNHEPLAYIREKSEFYGREFYINNHVLVPRPESETMIELLSELPMPEVVNITDVGTGSGALGITAALELARNNHAVKRLTLVDIDTKCLDVARVNDATYKSNATVLKADLLDDASPCDIILANLPYVPDEHTINRAAMIEPKLAIFGGSDGLKYYRKMFRQLTEAQSVWRPQYVLTESLPFQHEALATLADQHGYDLATFEDFIQVYTRKP